MNELRTLARQQHEKQRSALQTEYRKLEGQSAMREKNTKPIFMTTFIVSLVISAVSVIEQVVRDDIPAGESLFTIVVGSVLGSFVITGIICFLYECASLMLEQSVASANGIRSCNEQKLDLLKGLERIDAFYMALDAMLTAIRDGSAQFINADVSPQCFALQTELKADITAAVATGKITITPVSHTGFMTSVYGDSRPSAEEQFRKSVQLQSKTDFERWDMLSKFDVIEMPCVSITLFPGIVKDKEQWTFLVMGRGSPEDICTVFENMCRIIVCDVISEKLKRAGRGWRSATFETSDIIEDDLAPYFRQKDKRPPDVQQAFEETSALLEEGRKYLTESLYTQTTGAPAMAGIAILTGEPD